MSMPTHDQSQEGSPLCIAEYLLHPQRALRKKSALAQGNIDLLRRNNGSFLEKFLESCPDFLHMLRKIQPPTCQNLEARFNVFYFL